jgi:hypothetical protein
MASHTHTCDCCGDIFACAELNAKTCVVALAAKVNKAGPYCMACYHGIMFARHAGKRALYLGKIIDAYERGKKRPATVDSVITGSQKPKNQK